MSTEPANMTAPYVPFCEAISTASWINNDNNAKYRKERLRRKHKKWLNVTTDLEQHRSPIYVILDGDSYITVR